MASIAMMICDALSGGGGVLSVVSVLCGAGGGLTVHAVTSINVEANAPATTLSRREVVGTVFRLTAGLRPGLRPCPQAGDQLDLAHPHDLRRDLDAFVLGAELHRLLQAHLQRAGQRLEDVG